MDYDFNWTDCSPAFIPGVSVNPGISEPVIVHQGKTPGNPEPVLVDPKQALQELRSLIPTRPDVAFFRTDSDFLLRFLVCRKYRVSEAFKVLSKYFIFRHQSRDLCVGLSPSNPEVQRVIRDGTVGVLSELDPCGRKILIILAANWNYREYGVRVIYQTILLTLEHLIQDPVVQRTGIVAIVDLSHIPSKLAATVTPRTMRVFLEGLQEAFPMRLCGLHIVSAPWYIEAALGLCRPFLKEKLRGRIYFHGNNLHTLHSIIPPRILPAELGGEGPEYDTTQWAKQIIPQRKYLSKSMTVDDGMSNVKLNVMTHSLSLGDNG